MIRSRRFGLLLIVVLAAACSSSSRTSTVAPVAAQLSVERFLQAANERDYESMGRLFGTSSGSVMDTTGSTFGCFFKKIGSWFGGSSCTKRVDVELRMDAIASILNHEDYRIAREESVAGRNSPARRVIVDLTIDGDAITAVPFIVVQTSQGRWLVEQVPLERIMAAR